MTGSRFLRPFFFFLLLLLGFEAAAHLAPYVVGNYVHRPLRYVEQRVTDAPDQQNQVRWLTDRDGARAYPKRPADVSIAFFGSSTTMGSTLDQPLTLPEQVRRALLETGVVAHVQGFARDGAGSKEIEVLFQDLIASGKRYDMIFIMDHFDHMDRPATRKSAYRYTSEWLEEGLIKAPALASRRLKQQFDREARLNAIKDRIKRFIPFWPKPPTVTGFRHPGALSIHNRASRASGKVTLVDGDPSLSAERLQYIDDRVDLMTRLGTALSDRVILLTQPVAYDAAQHSGVPKRWFSLYPVSDTKPLYESNKTVADRFRLINDRAARRALLNGLDVIPLDDLLRPHLRTRDDLFLDKWHFAPAGAELAAKLLVGEL